MTQTRSAHLALGRLATLQDDLSTLVSECQSLNEQTRLKAAELARKDEVIQQLQTKLNETRLHMENVTQGREKEITSLRRDLQMQTSQLETVRQEYQRLQQEFERKKEFTHHLETAIDDLKEDYENQAVSLRREIEGLSQQNQRLQLEVEAEGLQKQELQKTMTTLEEKLTAREQHLVRLQGELSLRSSSLQNKDESQKSLLSKLTYLEQNYNRVKSAYERLNAAYAKTQVDGQRWQMQIENLTTRLEETKQAKNALETEKREMATRLEDIRLNNDRLRLANEDLTKNLLNAQKALALKTTETQSVTMDKDQELTKLRQELEQVKILNARNEAASQEKNNYIAQLSKTAADLMASLSDLQAHNVEERMNEVSSLKSDFNELIHRMNFIEKTNANQTKKTIQADGKKLTIIPFPSSSAEDVV